MKFDINKLREYEKEGWIMSHEHKQLPLIIWNYTQATQYEAKWDEITLSCRGMVTDIYGDVIAKGFSKFFNYEENRTTIPENLEWTRVYVKLDGSFIQIFNYEGVWVVNSKGSFYSDHVGWAEEILNERLPLTNLNKTWTYCFELIHPQNRIVVDYGDKRDLIFLGAFYKGKEIDIYTLPTFESVKSRLIKFDYEALKSLNIDNEEGYVVKFSNGERCKIKFQDYIRLHRILTEVSSYRVYEALRDGVDLNVWLEGVPDEFFNWIKNTKYEIEARFHLIKGEIITEYLNYSDIETDKAFAFAVKDNSYRAPFFKLRKGRNIDDWIWKKCKPRLKYPFKNE